MGFVCILYSIFRYRYMIYYLKHIAIEGPGTLGKFFAAQGIESRIIELYNGDLLPEKMNDDDMVVILGGPMNVYEEEKHPFLKAENIFIQELIKKDILTIGLCLGAQLIAKAAGAQVYKAPEEEIGIYNVFLTQHGLKDPLFNEVGREICFFQWHGDTFDIPKKAFLLGFGADCPNQIFRLGMKVYGFQCHMEIDELAALSWVDEYVKDETANSDLKLRLSKEFKLYQEKLCQTAEKTYNNLLKLI